MKTWIITGCSSGLGKSLAETALQGGDNVVITARHLSDITDIASRYPDKALACELDVTVPAQITAVVNATLQRFGSIDVVVNNAGYGYRSAVEEGDEEDITALFDTNVFGPVRLIKAVLPGMRALKKGTIINVSSIGARRTPPGSGYYSATKSALESISEGLRKEVKPLGIDVIIVEPGGFRTNFGGRSLKQSPYAIADYADTAGLRRKENDKTHGHQAGDPSKAAQIIVEVVNGNAKPARLLLGSDAVKVVTDELRTQLEEISTWKNISVRTDFD